MVTPATRASGWTGLVASLAGSTAEQFENVGFSWRRSAIPAKRSAMSFSVMPVSMGKRTSLEHDVVAIAVADERLGIAEHPGQGVEQPGMGEQRRCQTQGVVIEDQLFARSLLAGHFLQPFEAGLRMLPANRATGHRL